MTNPEQKLKHKRIYENILIFLGFVLVFSVIYFVLYGVIDKLINTSSITKVKPPQKEELKKSKEVNKVDSSEDKPDFGPYLKNAQNKIKKNWNPPKSNTSTRVIAVFTINKKGNLMNIKISQSSKDPNIDKAAIKSIKSAAPFGPLPKGFKGKDIDIHFTFDYNVFGVPK